MPYRAQTDALTMTKLVATLLFFLFPNSVWAFSEPLQSLDINVLNAIVISVGIVLLVLVILLFVFKRKVGQNQQALLDSDQRHLREQEKSDRFISGILHLDDAGNILYANQMAAYFLVKKLNQLVGTSFVQACPNEIREQVKDALSQTQETHIQCALAYRQRQVRMRIARQKKPINETVTLVALEDIDIYQQQIDQQIDINQHRESAVLHAGIGLASLDIINQTLSLNEPLRVMLGQDVDEALPLNTFTQLVASSDSHEWERALKQLSDGQTIELKLQLQIKDKLMPMSIKGQPRQKADEKQACRRTTIRRDRLCTTRFSDELLSGP